MPVILSDVSISSADKMKLYPLLNDAVKAFIEKDPKLADQAYPVAFNFQDVYCGLVREKHKELTTRCDAAIKAETVFHPP